jgi:peptidoglycan hydrolase CwlO-like protein
VSGELSAIKTRNELLEADRRLLDSELRVLKARYDSLQQDNDSIKKVLAVKKKELTDMQKKHQREIDSLLNVPDDTVYVRLQPFYPNTDNSPLQYPFSGIQIRGIYHTAVSYPRLRDEYQAQGKVLGSCNDLNRSYERSIGVLDAEVSKLGEIVQNADKQITGYKEEIKIVEKQVRQNRFWRRFFEVTTGIGIVIAAVK